MSELDAPAVALVGCGNVGEIHRDRLLAAGARIVAISDPDADALARMAASLPRRPKLFRTERDLLAAELVEGVILCTPHGQHARQIEAALDAGVSVLCEKPFVMDLELAERLVERAKKQDRTLYVSFTRRGRGHARFLAAAAKRIGPIRQVEVLRTQPWLETHKLTWRVHPEDGGGFLLDNGVSMIDLVVHLLDEPCVGAEAILRRRGGVEVDIECQARVSFSSGATACLTLLGDCPETTERILLFGENGTAAWNLRDDSVPELYVRPAGGPTERGNSADFRALTPDEAFVAALRGENPPPLHDAATALPTVEIVERLFQTARWE